MSRPPISLRLPDALYDRVETIAKAQGISVSAAIRIALQRGLAAFEKETEPAAASPPRRKLISPGVD